jgi:hypothetical protein
VTLMLIRFVGAGSSTNQTTRPSVFCFEMYLKPALFAKCIVFVFVNVMIYWVARAGLVLSVDLPLTFSMVNLRSDPAPTV